MKINYFKLNIANLISKLHVQSMKFFEDNLKNYKTQ